MDYHDHNDYPSYPNEERRNWLIPLLLGMIIGILIVTVVVPFVLGQTEGESTEEVRPAEENSVTVPDERPTEQKTHISVDVTTQITEVVDQVLPSVVGVTNIQMRADFWRQQYQNNEAGTGSGVIYKKSGDDAFIVTNHHVIEGADVIEVVLSDETTIEADLLGSDVFTDLAVLRIDGKDVGDPIEMGSSSNLKIGEPAIAIGNPLGHMFAGSVTQGVISGTQRTIPVDINQDGRPDWQAEVIQTDAAINPGNSGGALINIHGQLIGINSMKINQTAVEGIGFAIPIDIARPIIEDLETKGEVTRPYIGVEIYSLEEVPRIEWERTLKLPPDVEGGVYIWTIEPLSPAQKAGLKRLDVITEIDGEPINGIVDLRRILYQEKKVGDEITVTYYREGEKSEVKLTLGVQE